MFSHVVIGHAVWGDLRLGRFSVSRCLPSVSAVVAPVSASSSSSNMAALIESTSLPVTALYAGLLTILFAYLALRVGLTRASNGVMHGDGGKQDMVRKARVCCLYLDKLP